MPACSRARRRKAQRKLNPSLLSRIGWLGPIEWLAPNRVSSQSALLAVFGREAWHGELSFREFSKHLLRTTQRGRCSKGVGCCKNCNYLANRSRQSPISAYWMVSRVDSYCATYLAPSVSVRQPSPLIHHLASTTTTTPCHYARNARRKTEAFQ